MNKILCIFVLSFCTLLLGCSKVEYDFKSLGFSNVADMQAAFVKGYHTKQKLDEMVPAAISPTVSPAVGRTEIHPPVIESKQEVAAHPESNAESFAPSFECSKAFNKVEKIICNDRELSMLDVELSRLYQIAKETLSDKDQLKKDQISWIKLSRACEDRSCLINALEMRIKQLKK